MSVVDEQRTTDPAGVEGPGVLASRSRIRTLSVGLNVAGAVFTVASVGFFKGGIAHSALDTALAMSAICVAGFLFLAAQIDAFKRREEQGHLQAAERRLVFGGKTIIEPGAFRDAVAYSNGPSRHGVRARTRWRSFHFDVESREVADRIVSALGLDSRRAIVGFQQPGGLWIFLMWVAAMAVGRFFPTIVASMAIQFAIALHRQLGSPRCVVGADGVLVERFLGLRKRFLPFADIKELNVDGANLTITLPDATGLVIQSEDDSKETYFPVVGAHALKARIEGARASAGASRAAEVARDLARGGRDVATWLSAVRQIGAARATFRDAAIPRERLWSALEDGAQPAEVRVAAAVALQAALAASERVRFASVASACAAPRLRVALEAVGEEDEERTAEAVGELARERGAVRRG